MDFPMGCKLERQRHCLETRWKKNNSEVISNHDKKPQPENHPSSHALCLSPFHRGDALRRAG
jgi:hypothetical protein